MGLKPRPKRPAVTASDVVERWMAASEGREAHVYTREFKGVRVLMFVSGDRVDAETGLGLGVQAVISAEITNSPSGRS